MTTSRTNRSLPGGAGLARSALVACALVLVLVAAGCGSSSNEGVATLAETTSSSAATSTETTTSTDGSSDPQQAALDWAACMRKNGVNIPDPQVDADGRIQIGPGPGSGGGARIGDVDSAKFENARKACGSPFGRGGGGPQLSEADREAMQSAALKFAACMRKNGVDMPDPDFSGGGGFFRAGPGQGNGRELDPSGATFRKAQKTCQPILQEAMPDRGEGGPAVSVGGGSSESSS